MLCDLSRRAPVDGLVTVGVNVLENTQQPSNSQDYSSPSYYRGHDIEHRNRPSPIGSMEMLIEWTRQSCDYEKTFIIETPRHEILQ